MKRAVLLLDLQADFLSEQGRMPVSPAQAGGVIQAANALLAHANNRYEVICIVTEFSPWDIPANWFRHNAAIRGRSGCAPDPRVLAAGRPRFTKSGRNALRNPALARYLAEQAVTDIVIAGVFAGACVTATAEAALRMGYAVVVLSDAMADRTDGRRQQALERLAAKGVRIRSTADFMAQD